MEKIRQIKCVECSKEKCFLCGKNSIGVNCDCFECENMASFCREHSERKVESSNPFKLLRIVKCRCFAKHIDKHIVINEYETILGEKVILCATDCKIFCSRGCLEHEANNNKSVRRIE